MSFEVVFYSLPKTFILGYPRCFRLFCQFFAVCCQNRFNGFFRSLPKPLLVGCSKIVNNSSLTDFFFLPNPLLVGISKMIIVNSLGLLDRSRLLCQNRLGLSEMCVANVPLPGFCRSLLGLFSGIR